MSWLVLSDKSRAALKASPTLETMYRLPEYEHYIDDKLGNQLFIDDPDRANRIAEAAENGADGSTHAEVIDDWHEFLHMLSTYDPEFDTPEEEAGRDISQANYDKIDAEIHTVEEWHVKNGSYDKEVG